MLVITPEYLEYMKLEMHAGRNLTKADNQGKKRVCLIADTMPERYFAGKDPIGETLSVQHRMAEFLILL